MLSIQMQGESLLLNPVGLHGLATMCCETELGYEPSLSKKIRKKKRWEESDNIMGYAYPGVYIPET